MAIEPISMKSLLQAASFDWLSLIPALATLAGAAISYYGSYRAQEKIEQNRRDHQREGLRSMLETELATANTDHYTNLSDNAIWSIPYDSLIPRTIYDSNSGRLGLLTNEESKKVVDYYSYSEFLRSHWESLNEDRENTLRGANTQLKEIRDQLENQDQLQNPSQYPQSIQLIDEMVTDAEIRNEPIWPWDLKELAEVAVSEGWDDVGHPFAQLHYALVKLNRSLHTQLCELHQKRNSALSAIRESGQTVTSSKNSDNISNTPNEESPSVVEDQEPERELE